MNMSHSSRKATLIANQEDNMILLDIKIWKCRNCGSEWLIDEVGEDWEENGCPGCPPEEDEISFD